MIEVTGKIVDEKEISTFLAGNKVYHKKTQKLDDRTIYQWRGKLWGQKLYLVHLQGGRDRFFICLTNEETHFNLTTKILRDSLEEIPYHKISSEENKSFLGFSRGIE